MSLIGRIFGSGSSNVVDSVSNAGQAFFGNKAEREQAEHLENMAVHNQHSAEYQYRGVRFYFDAFVDGVNRLVRPLFTYGITAIFGWATWGASDFLDFTTRLATIPQPLWVVMGTIIAFWFGSRSIFKDRQIFNQDINYVKGVYKAAQQVRDFQHRSDIEIEQESDNKTIKAFKESRK